MMLRNLGITAAVCMSVACGNAGKTGNTGDSTATTADTALAVTSSATNQLDVTPITEGHFLKNTIKVTDSLTFWVISNQAAFDSLFGIAKTMNNKIIAPDFGTQLVLAASMPSTEYGTEIQLQSATLNNNTNTADLHFVANAGPDGKLSYSITPVWIGTIPKTGKMELNFFTGDHKTTTITVNE